MFPELETKFQRASHNHSPGGVNMVCGQNYCVGYFQVEAKIRTLPWTPSLATLAALAAFRCGSRRSRTSERASLETSASEVN